MRLVQGFSLKFYIIITLNVYHCNSQNSVETEESLREDLQALFAGTLNFTDDSIPRYEDELPDVTPTNGCEYDFIVIGAGSGGATIASRLSEIKDVTVLLIEAGSKEYPIMDIPAAASSLQSYDELNWNYETESSDICCQGFTDSKNIWPRGKVMGGTSVLNFMLMTRGNRRDFDSWANITGDDSWSYKEMLKYLKKLEDYRVTNVPVEQQFHNKRGPIPITSWKTDPTLGRAFINAGKELGYSEVDYNGREQMGFSYYQSNIKNGERWSTNRAYLHPANSRKNLFLSRSSHVQKIRINKQSKVAYGVQFSKAGQIVEVRAKKEIILSAGAINSPQILMLSGIGPSKHLRDLGIDVIQDLPVGENLMDHFDYCGLVFKVNDSATFNNISLLDSRNPAVHDFVTRRDGSLTMSVGYLALGYVNVDDTDPANDDPNMELLFGPTGGIKDLGTATGLGLLQKYRDLLAADVFNHTAYTIFPMIMKPKSRGKILLRSKDPLAKPKLYPNYLSHEDDVKTMVKGIRYAIKLTETQSLKRFGSELYDVPLPCDQHEKYSDDYWECAVRTYTLTTYHPSGTCKMGREADKDAVVNSKLQVIGVKGLRVVDASVVPVIPTIHLNAPVIAIAEKVADLIKNHLNLI